MNTFHGVRRSVSLHLPLESQHVAERGAADVKRKGKKKPPSQIHSEQIFLKRSSESSKEFAEHSVNI